jgi:hypothetical protein
MRVHNNSAHVGNLKNKRINHYPSTQKGWIVVINVNERQAIRIDLAQCRIVGDGLIEGMPTILFRCPNTGFRVQGYTAGETSDDGVYEAVHRLQAGASCEPGDWQGHWGAERQNPPRM